VHTRSAADTMHSWKTPRYDLAAAAIAPLQVLRFTTTYLKLVLAGQVPHKKQSIKRVQEQARKQVRDLNGFDYNAPAELFPTPSKTRTGNLRYKRFDTAAEALRFAVEEIPAPALMGAYLEVDEARFGTQEIRCLYENAAYPLTRPKMLSGVRGG
jgi:hypothetical protein